MICGGSCSGLMSHLEIRDEWPPNIEAIRAVLPVSEGNIFAWAPIIYNPGGGELSEALIGHEKVHFAQQGGNPAKWWRKFLKDPEFRLSQELEAHREEYRVFCWFNRDRNAQARYLLHVAKRLAKPMYGGIITVTEAREQIKRGPV